jgi:hypothetical protein
MQEVVRADAVEDDMKSTQSTSGSESEEELADASTALREHLHLQCRFQHPPCTQPRRVRPDGTYQAFCDGHRRQESHTQHRQRQRERLLRVLVRALQEGAEGITEGGQERRRRPRLVLLGNQSTLILGVVLSERGDLRNLHSMPS